MENLLPADIKLDIFSRLPAESVLQCRQVCKTWRSLLHLPVFAHMHLCRTQHLEDHSYDNHSNDAAKMGLLLLVALKGERYSNYQLCYHEYDENDERSFKLPLTIINHPVVKPTYALVGSCNGLIYFTLKQPYNDPFYICNPITREYVILPRFNNSNLIVGGYPKGCMVWGFGYLPSTNEYKVVRIHLYTNPYQPSGWYKHDEIDAQVYTLGSGSGWRKIKYSSPLPICKLLAPWGVLANGALYWLGSGGKSFTFDLADEELRYFLSPPYEDEDNYSYFQMWGGRLSYVHKKVNEGIDIWSFKKNKKSGGVQKDMKEQEYQSWNWSKEFTIAMNMEAGDYEPFALTKSGEVLMSFRRSYEQKLLSRYDPKTATLTKLDTDFVLSSAITHVNSFVSLKDIGEDAKIIEPAEGLPELVKLQPECC
ncbi:F-box domain [Macleaya cordata]|uniref:F-box domain n=1 Tax=Macleaya cordata TaxID=56857 RepID=A0A200QT41_MACCD|nr:F-box domain [Macleaya cordata]